MSTILLIEDRRTDRQHLTAILRTCAYRVVAASDGDDAFDKLPEIRPDVIIADILLPTADVCAFVGRMRAVPEFAATPVIFYTATYHEREGRALARQCNVADVLTNPVAPQVLLAIVEAAIGSSTRATSAPPGPASLPARADRRADRFEAEQERMKRVVEIVEQVADERDPLALVYKVCTEARYVTLAQHAVVGFFTEEGTAREILYTSGLDAAREDRMTRSIGGALLDAVRERRPIRVRNSGGRPEALGLPADHPKVSSLLSVPIASPRRVYGWLSLRNKLGTDEFTDVDERVALTLGVHAGIAYEHARSLDGMQRRLSALERDTHRLSGIDEGAAGVDTLQARPEDIRPTQATAEAAPIGIHEPVRVAPIRPRRPRALEAPQKRSPAPLRDTRAGVAPKAS